MAHMVKCTVCGETFNRDKVQAVKTGARRYAHLRCFPQGEKVPMPSAEPADEDLEKLETYIKELLHEEYINARVKKQLKDFREQYGYSYSGILKSLIYFYEVKGNSKEKANGGIGIVPFVYKDAYTYYYNLFVAQNQNKNKDIASFTKKIKEVIIKLPSVEKPHKRLFNLDDDGETEDNE